MTFQQLRDDRGADQKRPAISHVHGRGARMNSCDLITPFASELPFAGAFVSKIIPSLQKFRNTPL
jgi:hypothetical protein